MLKRPKSGDDESDILHMQEEYLKEKNKNKNFEPAAKVVNLRVKSQRPETIKSGPRNPSKYAQKKGLKNTKTVRFESSSASMIGDIVEKNLEESAKRKPEEETEDKIHYPRVVPSVLGNVIEKNINTASCDNYTMPTQGFPEVYKHEQYEKKGNESIFLQHISKLNQENKNPGSSLMEIGIENPKMTLVNQNYHKSVCVNIPNKSYILTCEDADLIHKENTIKLNSMSELEILEEQNKLKSSLRPEMIAFFKSKRDNLQKKLNLESINVKTDQLMDISETPDESQTDDSLWDNDILSHPYLSTWLNFNTYEKDKLAWLKGMEESSTKPNEPHEARFDFKGYLLPYTIEYTEETKTLFHHGQEPNRPGYTLSELIQLSRSSVIQQRVMALNVIAGILEYYMSGFYKNVIEIPLSKLLFIIRFALDENKIIILEPALKAMRNLLYNRLDEAALDGLIGTELGMSQPSFENDKSEIKEIESKEVEVKDFHLAEIDLIAAIIRTDIIQRLQYILSSIKPGFSSVQYCLQILIRLLRDSIGSAQKILDTEFLMSTIITNFVPATSINFNFSTEIVYKGKPVLVALKFLRILSLQSNIFCKTLVDKYCILMPLSQYINSEIGGTYGLRIQIETFAILTNLVYYDIAIDEVVSLLPLIVLMLYKHVHGTDVLNESSVLSSLHASAILQLVNLLLRLKIPSIDQIRFQLVDLIMKGMKKWLAQIGNTGTCFHINVVSAVLDGCRTNIQDNLQKHNLTESLLLFHSSNGFNVMVEHLIKSSNLLSGFDVDNNIHKDKNIMSLGTCVVDCSEPVLPVLNKTSSMLFLTSLFKVVYGLKNPDLTKKFVKKLHNYLNKFRNVTPSLCSNWFTRIEVDFIFTIIQMVTIAPSIEETQKDTLYVLANKLCYILRIDKRMELDFLFNEIVFNKDWFTAERLMKLVSVSDGIFSLPLDVEEIKNNYKKVINIGYKDIEQNFVLRDWQEPILPRDWIYLPILNLYLKSQEGTAMPLLPKEIVNKENRLAVLEKETILYSNLQWIIFNEVCFSDLLTDINITDRLCRIMCVFLCDNSLFLEPKINSLLKHCIQILFKKEKKNCFNFDKPLIGLHNFQDFYTQFLEQFQSVSYGNVNFSSCVFVPLAQKHNVKWRKLVWSEYAGCLRALDCPVELLCYELESYFYPEETDESLIRSYLMALSGNLLRSGSLAHRIASHHVECFKNIKS